MRLLLSVCVSVSEREEMAGRVYVCVCGGGVLLVVSLYRIQRTPGGVEGVVHESGTKTYLHIPIIPRESEMKTLLL